MRRETSAAASAHGARGDALAAVLRELALGAVHLAEVKERDGVGVEVILDEEFLRLRACAQHLAAIGGGVGVLCSARRARMRQHAARARRRRRPQFRRLNCAARGSRARHLRAAAGGTPRQRRAGPVAGAS